MSAELRQLYQEVLIDHAKRPRNFREQGAGAVTVEGYNPLCGDRIRLYVSRDDGQLRDLSFTGSGCAISTASASMMTEALKGKTAAEAEALAERFHRLVTAAVDAAVDEEGLGKLAIFAGVREFPVRVKCATLAWHSLRSALHGDAAVVSTE
ncbi:MAG TPA: SUF system NifU family Fe-S cluster assembly protein [Candidatus Eisenbacteria bacterium]|nr:SUF system NifU family Fe-S cluster assembly protein [Candidatus Eisenbacteria bacterium]